MESNWRLNVAKIGWSSDRVVLAARRADTPFIWILKIAGDNGTYVPFTYLVPGMGTEYWWAFSGVPKMTPRFPYGFDVLPD